MVQCGAVLVVVLVVVGAVLVARGSSCTYVLAAGKLEALGS